MSRVALHWQILGGMLLGATLGLALNFTASDRQSELVPEDLPAGLTAVSFHDSSNRIDIRITDADGQTRHLVVDGTREADNSVSTLDQLAKKDSEAHDLFVSHGRSWSRWARPCS